LSIIRDLLTYDFLRHSLIATLLASISTGLVSPIIVYRGMEFIGDGLAHALFAGVAVAIVMNFNIFLGAILATVSFAYLIHKIKGLQLIRESTAIGILLPVFMSFGVIVFSKSPRYTADVTSYLFGNILMVVKEDLYLLGAIALASSILISRKIYEIAYWISDEDMARFYGIDTESLRMVLLFLIAFIVVSALKIAGVIVMGAFLVIPGVFAKAHSSSLKEAILKAISFNMASSLLGFTLSYYFDLPPGPTLVLFGFLLLLGLTLLSKRIAS